MRLPNRSLNVIILFILIAPLTGQADNQWTNFTNADRVYDTYRTGDTLWCATIGGLVKWNLRDSTYTKYTSIEGLPELICSAVTMDSQGILWIESGGLTSFDGTTFTNYPSFEGNSLGGWGDLEIHEDETWVKTYGGVLRIKDGEWTFWGKEDGLISTVNDIDVDIDGSVWAATNHGLFRYNGQTWSKKEGLPYNEVTAVTHDENGNIYAGSRRSLPGPEVYDSSIGAVSKYDGSGWLTYNLTGTESWQYARCLCAAGDTLFVSKSYTISVLDARTMQPLNETEHLFDLTSDEINVDNHGTIWFSTWTGLYRLDGDTLVKYPMNEGIAHPCIYDIAIDSYGNTWIATNGGVSCYDGVTWRSYNEENGLYSNEVRSIAAGLNGEVWTSHENGISHFNGNVWNNAYESSISTEIGVDQNGIAWIGSLKHSRLLRYNGRNFTTYIIPGEIDHNPFYDIEFDKAGNIWCATYNGIAKLSFPLLKDWEIITTEQGLPDNKINDIAFDKDGNIWAATDQGLAFRDHGTWEILPQPAGRIRAVSVAPDGTVWAASSDGLTCITANGWHTFTREDGLIHNSISDIAISPDGAVWASYRYGFIGGGISRLIPDMSTCVQEPDMQDALPLHAISYPNPFNPIAMIEYSLLEATHVNLSVFSVTGQAVETIIDDFIPAGTHTAVFDGSECASGMYYYRLESEGAVKCGKMLLVK